MNHLVITVSLESSISLLADFADSIVLDTDPIPASLAHYDTIYIRSHFSQPSTLPQNFRTEIETIIQRAKQVNPHLTFIDHTDTIEKILEAEDKWQQYMIYSDFMSTTRLLDDEKGTAEFHRPVYKNRLSSRGAGVTWDREKVTVSTEHWIVQESLDIAEELRVYVIRGEVYPTGAVRQSKTTERKTQIIDARDLTQDEIDFSFNIGKRAVGLDMIGLDIARTTDGKLYLLEVNRSPGFAAFYTLTGVNLASVLYRTIS